MPIYPIPDVGEKFEDAYPKLLTVVFKFKTMVDSMYSHFNSTSFLDLNSYRVRCLKKILKMVETYCFIASKHEDMCSANIMTRCIVDNTAAFLLIYDDDNDEMVWLRHYLAILDSLESRDKALKDTSIEYTDFESEAVREAVINMNIFTTERAKSAKETCLANIRKLSLYASNSGQVEGFIESNNWRFRSLNDTGRRMSWWNMYSFRKNIAPANLTEYLSQDVHGLSFSVENIEAEPKAFVGGIEQVGYCCQLLGQFICERLKHLNTDGVKASYKEILKEANAYLKQKTN